jgi:rSAM-associated Gly-rich repeat protein
LDITTRTSLVGFLLAVSAFSLPAAATTANSPTAEAESASPTIESRLSRLTVALRERAEQLPEASEFTGDSEIAAAWVNARRGGGGFVNRNPWRNGWGDRGGFFNTRPRWGNGGGFLNRW